MGVALHWLRLAFWEVEPDLIGTAEDALKCRFHPAEDHELYSRARYGTQWGYVEPVSHCTAPDFFRRGQQDAPELEVPMIGCYAWCVPVGLYTFVTTIREWRAMQAFRSIPAIELKGTEADDESTTEGTGS